MAKKSKASWVKFGEIGPMWLKSRGIDIPCKAADTVELWMDRRGGHQNRETTARSLKTGRWTLVRGNKVREGIADALVSSVFGGKDSHLVRMPLSAAVGLGFVG